MENEKTESCAIVAVETVDADLIFEGTQIQVTGIGSRKIVRESLLNQLQDAYPMLKFENVEVINEIKLSRSEKSIASVLSAIKNLECCNRNDIERATGLSKTTVIRIVNELFESGLIDEGIISGAFYYRIALK